MICEVGWINKSIFTCGSDGIIKFWDINKNKLNFGWFGHNGKVKCWKHL